MQNPEIYINDTKNIFHQLRGHYLKINIDRHTDFVNEIVKKEEITPIYKKPMQMKILEGRIHKLKYEKLRKKGEQIDEEKLPNLQTQILPSPYGYYTLDYLLDKLKENDAPVNEIKLYTWRQLSEETQKIKMQEFLNKFKKEMDEEIWFEMSKDVFRNLKTMTITWHKNSQKIMEIPNLVINQSCFFWNLE